MKIYKICLVLFFCFASLFSRAQRDPEGDARIRAVFIYNFTKYCSWSNFNTLTEFKIGIKTKNSLIKKALIQVSNSKTVNGIQFKIVDLNEVKDDNLQLIYIDKADYPSYTITEFKKNVLIVSDYESDINQTMIAFVAEDKNIKFVVNEQNAKKAGLILDSKILALAFKVFKGGNKGDELEFRKKWTKIVESELLKKLGSGADIELTKNEASFLLNKFNTQDELIKIKTKKLDSIETKLGIKLNELEEKQLAIEKHKKEITEQQNILSNQKEELKSQLSQINAQRGFLWMSALTGTLIIIVLVFVFRSNKQKAKANALLEKQKLEIISQKKQVEEQKHLIEEHQREMVDSITYAKRIQDAILPPLELIVEKLPQSFVLYKPKDIVAGDFYWMEQFGDTVLIAAADCTGHGVPGAMVSVVCSNALNRAVKEFRLYDTGAILDKVTDLVLETFEKSVAEVKDGMDISLLSINTKTKEIKWSGANNPLWYFVGGELKEITADKQPIGKSDHRKPFTSNPIDFVDGTSFYLFTDGYADQFGGPKGKKYKYKQFQETILGSLNKAPKEQQNYLYKSFESWRGDLEQVDDVCVIGIRI